MAMWLMMSSVKTLSFIIAPIAAGVAVLAEPMIALLYQRGSFTEHLVGSWCKGSCFGFALGDG